MKRKDYARRKDLKTMLETEIIQRGEAWRRRDLKPGPGSVRLCTVLKHLVPRAGPKRSIEERIEHTTEAWEVGRGSTLNTLN